MPAAGMPQDNARMLKTLLANVVGMVYRAVSTPIARWSSSARVPAGHRPPAGGLLLNNRIAYDDLPAG